MQIASSRRPARLAEAHVQEEPVLGVIRQGGGEENYRGKGESDEDDEEAEVAPPAQGQAEAHPQCRKAAGSSEVRVVP